MKRIFLLLFIFHVSLLTFGQNGISADKLLDSATAKAKTENKNIFIISTASWCPPCKELKRILHDSQIQPLFEKNYVLVEFYTAERAKKMKNNNPGALEIINSYDGYTDGVPYWFILNVEGKKLGDSYNGGSKKNLSLEKYITYPDTRNQLKDFTSILKRTSTLTDSEIELISDRIINLIGIKTD